MRELEDWEVPQAIEGFQALAKSEGLSAPELRNLAEALAWKHGKSGPLGPLGLMVAAAEASCLDASERSALIAEWRSDQYEAFGAYMDMVGGPWVPYKVWLSRQK